jgi:hypothetical protein
MLLACITTPIFIHSSVVFIRLYWFEKRFQNVVQDRRLFRSLRARTRTRSIGREDHDPATQEHGVGGREIRVLHADGMNGQPHGPGEKDLASHCNLVMHLKSLTLTC